MEEEGKGRSKGDEGWSRAWDRYGVRHILLNVTIFGGSSSDRSDIEMQNLTGKSRVVNTGDG